jgi:acetyltransferase-like isoleucine patch superfamily enzyme
MQRVLSPKRLYLYDIASYLFPATRLFALKRVLLRWCGASIGSNVRIASSARFYLRGCLEIGDNTWIGHQVLIVGGDSTVLIGKDVDIAPRVSIVCGSHLPFGTPGKAAGPGFSSPIKIGDGAWIGAGATVLGGVEIGAKALVAAGALVRRNVGSEEVVAGVPAKLIRSSTEVGSF